MPASREPAVAAGFVPCTFERSYEIDASRDDVWAWLNDPDTFIRGQPWPYFVEFVGGGFEPGVQNTHTGPLLHCCGRSARFEDPITETFATTYGAYVLAMRWIRPTRLQFWLDAPAADRTTVRVRLDSQCRSWIRRLWALGNRCFWRLFGWSIRRGLAQRARRAARVRATEAR